MSKPLITIQCGNYSNYLGSHFWNLQESGFVYQQGQTSQRDEILEIDNDVLYREGKTLNKEITFTPRLISVDLKGSLGSLPECGELYGKISIPKEESLALHWSGGHQVFREEPFVKNEFLTELNEGIENVLNEKDIDKCSDENDINNEKKLYNLEGSVNFWSDYLGARYHPRSILLCENFQHKNTMHPFDAWGLGRDVWTDSSNFGDQMEDRVRWYAEECDVLGGFQLVSDNHDGFGGLSAKIAELLADEYHTKPVLSFPTSPAQFPASSNTAAEGGARVAGAVLSVSHLLTSGGAGVVTPLGLARDWWPLPGPGHVTSLPQLTFNSEDSYSSSAVLALALDTATLPYRRRQGGLSAGDVCSGLATNGRRVATVAAEVPLQIQPGHAVTEYFESRLLTAATPLAPGQAGGGELLGQEAPHSALVSLRGIKGSALLSKRSPGFSHCQDPASYLQSCVAATLASCSPLVSVATKPVMTGKPFPHIFGPTVNTFGELSTDPRPESVGVTFTPAVTSWSAGPGARASLASLAARAARLRLAKLHRLTETGLEEEEWAECLETIRQQCDNYSEELNY